MSALEKQDSQVIDFSIYRDDFPILSQDMNGKRFSYLDTASSAQKPKVVINTMQDVYETHYANIHRGLYYNSQVTTEMFESVRTKVADFIGVSSPNEIVFTRNTTESINLVAQSWGRINLRHGDEVILSEMEHHANIVPWQLLARELGVVIKIVPILDNGSLDFDAFISLLNKKTKLCSFVHVSNALGIINPVQKLVHSIKNFNADIKVLIDGSQAVVHDEVNVAEIGCDFYCFTGHKLYGPNGVGILWGRKEILDEMPPYQAGGDMIETVAFEGVNGAIDGTTFKDAPARFEAGTPAIAEVIGLGAAIDYLNIVGMKNIALREKKCSVQLTEALESIEDITIYGNISDKVGIVSFNVDWAHAGDVAMILDQCGVAVRTGHHCCMPLMKHYGVHAMVRASLGLYSNEEDIKQLVESLYKAKELLA